jgi:hypothetical protein
MPTRMLREGFVTSERIGALSDDAFRFYFSLFALVDDYGCIEWSPLALRGKLFPYAEPQKSTVEMRELLEKCLKGPRPLILFYEVNGKSYIQIQEFDQRKQSKPKCPLPEIHGGKPLLSEARAESETKSKSETKAVAPPRPPRLIDDGFAGPDLAKATTTTICEHHAACGFIVGNPETARRLMERYLAETGPNMHQAAASSIAAHVAACIVWRAEKDANPAFKVPQVAWWLQDGGHLYAPARIAPAKALPAAKPFRREDLPR